MDVAIDHVLDEIGGDAARVQQGGALGSGAVAGHRPALSGQLSQQSKQFGLELAHISTEAGVALEGVQAGRAFTFKALPDLRRLPIGRGPPQPPAQRATVQFGKLRHLDNAESVATHEGVHGDCGKVTEMFMVNRVELGVGKQRPHTRVLHGDDSVVREQD